MFIRQEESLREAAILQIIGKKFFVLGSILKALLFGLGK